MQYIAIGLIAFVVAAVLAFCTVSRYRAISYAFEPPEEPRKRNNLICPACAIGRYGFLPAGKIMVLNNGIGTRHCTNCGYTWSSAADPPDAGGPYTRKAG